MAIFEGEMLQINLVCRYKL